MCLIRATTKNKTDIEDIFMTLIFPPKTITKSKTCNGDEWLAEEKGNIRKMSKLSEKAFAPPWDLGCFLWNCDCSIWQKEPIWNFGFFSQFQFQVLVGTGNILCKVWVTRAMTAEFRLLQKCHKYFPSCWFGSKLIACFLQFHRRKRNYFFH